MIKNVYALAPLQEGLYYHAILDRTSTAYFTQIVLRIAGRLDVSQFEAAWNGVIARHDALRTIFVHKGTEKPKQVVLHERRLAVTVHDLRGLSPGEAQRRVDELRADDLARPFDLARDLLLRVALFQLADDEHLVQWSSHHILLDGWCTEVLLGELLELYRAGVLGARAALRPAPQYRSFIQWLAQQDQTRALAYWSQYMAGFRGPTSPMRRTSDAHQGGMQSITRTLIDADARRLDEASRTLGVTASSFVQAVWALTLAEHTGKSDVAFGVTVSGRPPAVEGVERIVGLFINAVPVRAQLASDTTLATLARRLHADASLGSPYHYASLADVQAQLGTKAIFEHMFVYENYPENTALRALAQDCAGLSFTQIAAHERSNYPLLVTVLPGSAIRFDFETAHYDTPTIAALADRFCALLASSALDTSLEVGRLVTIQELTDHPEDQLLRTIQSRALSRARQASTTMVVTATFTADPLIEPMTWWTERHELACDIAAAPYGQLFQQLLDPHSELRQAAQGVVLVRVVDWLRDRRDLQDPQLATQLQSLARELETALAKLDGGNPPIVALLPHAPLANTDVEALVAKVGDELLEVLKTHLHLSLLDLRQLPLYLDTGEAFDAHADALGHIPFTDELSLALGTQLARRVVAMRKAPFKVLALDCDNTLWRGVCGEDGPRGVAITPAHAALQDLVKQKISEGFLVTLASKNRPEDVWRVFDEHPDMRLRRDDIVAARINWDPKPKNLQSLAQELSLGLDSFIFIDDNPVECAAMMAHCPEVLTIELPERADDIPALMEQVWALDRPHVTAEDARRTASYQQEKVRRSLEEEAQSLDAFLKSLALEVAMRPVEEKDLGRVAQLTQRTNQFNATTRRRSEAEVKDAPLCYVVEVRDRIGDYGLVGAVFAAPEGERLHVDSFMLSCRVLGRRVEKAVLSGLKRMAQARQLSAISIDVQVSERNEPFRRFVDEQTWQNVTALGEGKSRYDALLADLPAVDPALVLHFDATLPGRPSPAGSPCAESPSKPLGDANHERKAQGIATAADATSQEQRRPSWPLRPRNLEALHHPAHYLALACQSGSRLRRLLREVGRQEESGGSQSFAQVMPRTPLESQLLNIWRAFLPTQSFGVTDDFHAAGGHSLRATQIVARINRELALGLSLRELLDHPTVAHLAELLSRRQEQGETSLQVIPRAVGADEHKASPGQRRFWLMNQRRLDASGVYHVGGAFAVDGAFSAANFQAALQTAITRHEALRTVLDSASGALRTRLLPAGEGLAFERHDLSVPRPSDDESQERVLARILNAAQSHPFDLARGPLVRAVIVKLAEEHHVVALHAHHVVCDAWSFRIFVRDLEASFLGQESLPTLPLRYCDYAAWLEGQLTSGALQSAGTFWRDMLRALPERIDWPGQLVRQESAGSKVAPHQLALSAHSATHLGAWAQKQSVSLFATAMASLRVALFQALGRKDLVIATPANGRPHEDLHDIVGYFVNTLPLRLALEPDETLVQFVRRVQGATADALDRQLYPFDAMLADLGEQPIAGRSPIFDVLFVMHDAVGSQGRLGEAKIRPLPSTPQGVPTDLVVEITPREDGWDVLFLHDPQLLDPRYVARLARRFVQVLEAVPTHATHALAQLPHDLPDEASIIQAWSSGGAIRPRMDGAETVLDLIDEATAKAPSATAIVDGDEVWTYAALQAERHRVAASLAAQLGPQCTGAPIVVEMPRSAALVAAMLGIMDAGAVYIPCDPALPKARRELIARQADAALIMSELPERAEPHAHGERRRLPLDHIAYTIFTSGSTGIPKGVTVPHRGIVNTAREQAHLFGVQTFDRVLVMASTSFDASISEILMALVSGASLVMAKGEDVRDPARLMQLMARQSVSVATIPPAYLSALDPHALPSSLRVVVSAGERLAPADARRFAGRVQLFNAYGPTEAAICATVHRVEGVDRATSIAIGRPLAGTSVAVLDEKGRPCGIGVVGELYLGGVGLAAGYLASPEETASRFRGTGAGRLYRTGDRAAFDESGALHFHGRVDEQIKVRGVRVEPGEIETILRDAPGVQNAAVALLQQGSAEASLVAFVVAASGFDKALLRAHCKARLPDALLPTTFVAVASLPLTSSAKVDRRALASLSASAIAADAAKSQSKAPSRSFTETELALAGAFEDVLGIMIQDPEDDFFEKGGDSLKAIQLGGRLRARGYTLDLRDLFATPTVAALALRLTPIRST